MSQAPRVSIILLNWNQPDLTAACLRTLEVLTWPNVEVIVVDNGSVDDSVARLREDFPWIHLVESPTNLGFTGGNNLGIEHATGHWVLLLNNDTEVPPGFLEPLMSAAHHQRNVGALSPKLRFHDAPETLQYAGGGGFDLWTGRGLGWRGHGEVDEGQYDEVQETWSAHGAAFLVRREVLDQVGLLWDDFFIYYEELDWSVRIREAGWRVLFVPGSVVFHKESMTTGRHSPFKTYFMNRNRVLFVKRHGHALHQAAFTAWALGAVLPIHLTRHLRAGRRDLARALVRGLRDGFLSRPAAPAGAV
jgi:hypothetical protein